MLSRVQPVFVLGTDVYAAGKCKMRLTMPRYGRMALAALWQLLLPKPMAVSVFVKGTGVNVAGRHDNGMINTAKLWKNRVASSLTNGAFKTYEESVYVSKNDVYEAGLTYNGAKLIAAMWKNGVVSALTNAFNDGNAYAVFIK